MLSGTVNGVSSVTSTFTNTIGIQGKGPDSNGVKTQQWNQTKQFKSIIRIAGLLTFTFCLCSIVGFVAYKLLKPILFMNRELYGDLEISSQIPQNLKINHDVLSSQYFNSIGSPMSGRSTNTPNSRVVSPMPSRNNVL